MAVSLSYEVIRAIADAEGVDARELETPLASVIDPDALDSIFRGGEGTFTFRYLDHTVSVDHDGTVDVVPVEDA